MGHLDDRGVRKKDPQAGKIEARQRIDEVRAFFIRELDQAEFFAKIAEGIVFRIETGNGRRIELAQGLLQNLP